MAKCLVRCEIQHIGGDHREVRMRIDDHGRVHSRVTVPAASCRMVDGSPIADDWPEMWDGGYRPVWEPGYVEAEVVEPSLLELRFPNNQGANARPEAVRLLGSGGSPVYRMAVIGAVPTPGVS